MEQSILERLQREELQILIDFDKFCKSENLRYYLIGGALLGAARYQGFIPWDDDIDVAMPREDYERLEKTWKNGPHSDYFLQTPETDPNFARCIMKLRKNGTRIVEAVSQHIKMNMGIYIDIFPIDFLPEYDFETIDRRARKIRRLMSLRAIKSGYSNGRYPSMKRLIRCAAFFVSNQMLDHRINTLCKLGNRGERKFAILFLHNYSWEKQIHPADVFGRGAVCRFEGHDFIGPVKADEFLRKVFGKAYLEEPPVDLRVSPHKYVEVEFNQNG